MSKQHHHQQGPHADDSPHDRSVADAYAAEEAVTHVEGNPVSSTVASRAHTVTLLAKQQRTQSTVKATQQAAALPASAPNSLAAAGAAEAGVVFGSHIFHGTATARRRSSGRAAPRPAPVATAPTAPAAAAAAAAAAHAHPAAAAIQKQSGGAAAPSAASVPLATPTAAGAAASTPVSAPFDDRTPQHQAIEAAVAAALAHDNRGLLDRLGSLLRMPFSGSKPGGGSGFMRRRSLSHGHTPSATPPVLTPRTLTPRGSPPRPAPPVTTLGQTAGQTAARTGPKQPHATQAAALPVETAPVKDMAVPRDRSGAQPAAAAGLLVEADLGAVPLPYGTHQAPAAQHRHEQVHNQQQQQQQQQWQLQHGRATASASAVELVFGPAASGQAMPNTARKPHASAPAVGAYATDKALAGEDPLQQGRAHSLAAHAAQVAARRQKGGRGAHSGSEAGVNGNRRSHGSQRSRGNRVSGGSRRTQRDRDSGGSRRSKRYRDSDASRASERAALRSDVGSDPAGGIMEHQLGRSTKRKVSKDRASKDSFHTNSATNPLQDIDPGDLRVLPGQGSMPKPGASGDPRGHAAMSGLAHSVGSIASLSFSGSSVEQSSGGPAFGRVARTLGRYHQQQQQEEGKGEQDGSDEEMDDANHLQRMLPPPLSGAQAPATVGHGTAPLPLLSGTLTAAPAGSGPGIAMAAAVQGASNASWQDQQLVGLRDVQQDIVAVTSPSAQPVPAGTADNAMQHVQPQQAPPQAQQQQQQRHEQHSNAPAPYQPHDELHTTSSATLASASHSDPSTKQLCFSDAGEECRPSNGALGRTPQQLFGMATAAGNGSREGRGSRQGSRAGSGDRDDSPLQLAALLAGASMLGLSGKHSAASAVQCTDMLAGSAAPGVAKHVAAGTAAAAAVPAVTEEAAAAGNSRSRVLAVQRLPSAGMDEQTAANQIMAVTMAEPAGVAGGKESAGGVQRPALTVAAGMPCKAQVAEAAKKLDAADTAPAEGVRGTAGAAVKNGVQPADAAELAAARAVAHATVAAELAAPAGMAAAVAGYADGAAGPMACGVSTSQLPDAADMIVDLTQDAGSNTQNTNDHDTNMPDSDLQDIEMATTEVASAQAGNTEARSTGATTAAAAVAACAAASTVSAATEPCSTGAGAAAVTGVACSEEATGMCRTKACSSGATTAAVTEAAKSADAGTDVETEVVQAGASRQGSPAATSPANASSPTTTITAGRQCTPTAQRKGHSASRNSSPGASSPAATTKTVIVGRQCHALPGQQEGDGPITEGAQGAPGPAVAGSSGSIHPLGVPAVAISPTGAVGASLQHTLRGPRGNPPSSRDAACHGRAGAALSAHSRHRLLQDVLGWHDAAAVARREAGLARVQRGDVLAALIDDAAGGTQHYGTSRPHQASSTQQLPLEAVRHVLSDGERAAGKSGGSLGGGDAGGRCSSHQQHGEHADEHRGRRSAGGHTDGRWGRRELRGELPGMALACHWLGVRTRAELEDEGSTLDDWLRVLTA